MAKPRESETAPAAPEVSLFRDDLPFRAQRAIGLIPASGLGVGRRALLLALVTYVPIAVWAALTDRAVVSSLHPGEALLQHFGVTVRCLVAIPLLVIAEGVAHGDHAAPDSLLRELGARRRVGSRALREDHGGYAAAARSEPALDPDRRRRRCGAPVRTARGAARAGLGTRERRRSPTLGFGGFWFLYVVRPIMHRVAARLAVATRAALPADVAHREARPGAGADAPGSRRRARLPPDAAGRPSAWSCWPRRRCSPRAGGTMCSTTPRTSARCSRWPVSSSR